MRHRLILPAAIALLAFDLNAAGYTADFSSGNFPSRVTADNVNGMMPDANFYKHGYTRFGWVVGRFGNEFVAMSATHNGKDEPSENRMVFPQTSIETGMVLRWHSRSVLDHLPESYYIEALVTGEDTPVRLITVDAEPAEWTSHLVSLDNLAGKNVSVRIVCDSHDKYMLLLRDLYIGPLEQPDYVVTDLTAPYTTLDGAAVTLDVANHGSVAHPDAAVCLIDGQEVSRTTFDNEWATSASRRITLPTPTPADTRSKYEVWLEENGTLTTLLAEGSYFSSNFVRRLFVDKGTGTWCNNCPTGMLLMEGLEKRFGDSLVSVETHTGNDPMANQGYWTNLNFYAAPYFKLNRIEASAQSNVSRFEQYYDTPVQMAIDIEAMTCSTDHATVDLKIQAVEGIDNSADRYRIGYVVVKDFHEPGEAAFVQSNNSTLPSDDRFYILPQDIPSELMTYHNASMTYAEAFEGIAGSIASTIPADGATCRLQVERPAKMDNLRDGKIAVIIIDTTTGEVMNAASGSFANAEIDGITLTTADSMPMLSHEGNGVMRVSASGGWTLDVFDMGGNRLLTSRGDGQQSVDISTHSGSGMRVVRLTTPEAATTVKVII